MSCKHGLRWTVTGRLAGRPRSGGLWMRSRRPAELPGQQTSANQHTRHQGNLLWSLHAACSHQLGPRPAAWQKVRAHRRSGILCWYRLVGTAAARETRKRDDTSARGRRQIRAKRNSLWSAVRSGIRENSAAGVRITLLNSHEFSYGVPTRFSARGAAFPCRGARAGSGRQCTPSCTCRRSSRSASCRRRRGSPGRPTCRESW